MSICNWFGTSGEFYARIYVLISLLIPISDYRLAPVMFSLQQDAKRRSKEVSLALDIIGFSPSMVRWRQIHYDMRIKNLACNASKTTSPLPKFPRTAFNIFLTGSKQEGTSIWGGGDEDYMVVFNKYICVHDPNDVTADPGKVYIYAEDIKDEPGYMFLKKAPFTKLDMDQSVLDNFLGTCVTEDNYFSSRMINKLGYSAIKLCETAIDSDPDITLYINERTDIHKKMLSFETPDDEYPSIVCRFWGFGEHTADMVLGAFICNKPSTVIIEWARRKRYYNWPSKAVIDRIVKMPSYVVPKGCKGSESRSLEFRISYTLSEVELIKSLNETQLKIYILLKLLFQSEVDEQFPDIITSYCIKNVVFWLCEKAHVDQFVIESLLEWRKKGLIYILDCVREKNLPMYLMPKRNLLEGKLDTHNKPRLEKLLSHLIKEGPMVRVRKIRKVVETLRSDVIVAMTMGYMFHRGEMVLVNEREETTYCMRSVYAAFYETLYSIMQQVSTKYLSYLFIFQVDKLMILHDQHIPR